MSSRKLEDLLPESRVKVENFLAAALKEGLDLKVIETYRSPEDQQLDWLKGRDANGNIIDPHAVVTHARPWQSYHQVRRAADIVPLDGQGNIWWKAPQETWAKFGEIARQCGLVWGGDWPHGKIDLDHVEDSIGHSLAECRKELEGQPWPLPLQTEPAESPDTAPEAAPTDKT